MALVKSAQSILPLDASVIGTELDQFAEAMAAYLAVGGSEEVESIYNKRVRTYAAWLDALGFNLSERVKIHFTVESFQAIHRAMPVP